jgi:diguanylate cyclase (GGDEF)-like protein
LGKIYNKILLVDDNEDMLETLKHLFTLYDFKVVLAKNGKEALEIVRDEIPNLIILDALMPVMNGFETCKRLKAEKKTKEIPVIFLSANYTEDKHRVLGLELGADDYILKPFNAKELVTKVKSLLTHKEFLEKLRAENKQLLKEQSDYGKKLEELEKRTQELQKDVFIDETTGLYNGSYFLQRLNEEYYRSLRYTHELSIVVIDIDHFNQIDKEYGKKASEYVLMKVVNIILNNTRNSDVVFRTDNDKFGIILPNTDETGAFQEAERIRKAIDQTKVIDKELIDLNLIAHQRKHGIKNITTSIGITSLTDEIKKPDDLVNEVESALEKAKNEGHNITIKYSQLIKR